MPKSRSPFRLHLPSVGALVALLVASAVTQGVLAAEYTVTDLGTLGGRQSFAWGINESGQVVGDSETTDGAIRAFLYSGGTRTDLGTLGGGTSGAFGINAAGQIVGYSDTRGNSARHAFLYSGGTMTDLNDLVPAGITVTSARGINAAGFIAGVGRIGGGSNSRALLLTTLLNRFAYAWADSPTAASYTPDSHYAYNSSGGRISITRESVGQYYVQFDSLPGWGTGLSSTVAVTAYGSSPISCAVTHYSSPSSTVAFVGCHNIVTDRMADTRFTIMVVGNQSLPLPSAFVSFSGGPSPVPPPNPESSWTSGRDPITVTHNAAPGDYNVLLGTGITPKSATLVTAAMGGSRCNNAQPISGGLQVRCYDWKGVARDHYFSVVQVAGGRPGCRIGFALANLPTTASYTPNASSAFNSAGGAITATRSSVGHYAMNFAGLQKLTGRTEHVQVTSSSTTLATCNVISWGNSTDGLPVSVECRDGAGQFMDSMYDVLVIE